MYPPVVPDPAGAIPPIHSADACTLSPFLKAYAEKPEAIALVTALRGADILFHIPPRTIADWMSQRDDLIKELSVPIIELRFTTFDPTFPHIVLLYPPNMLFGPDDSSIVLEDPPNIVFPYAPPDPGSILLLEDPDIIESFESVMVLFVPPSIVDLNDEQ
jgi:hypothetical protein